jgi:hypothetical protein
LSAAWENMSGLGYQVEGERENRQELRKKTEA